MAQTTKTLFEPHSWALCLRFMMVVMAMLMLLAAVHHHIPPIPPCHALLPPPCWPCGVVIQLHLGGGTRLRVRGGGCIE